MDSTNNGFLTEIKNLSQLERKVSECPFSMQNKNNSIILKLKNGTTNLFFKYERPLRCPQRCQPTMGAIGVPPNISLTAPEWQSSIPTASKLDELVDSQIHVSSRTTTLPLEWLALTLPFVLCLSSPKHCNSFLLLQPSNGLGVLIN